MSKIKTILVDDDPHALALLEMHLSGIDEVEVIGVFENAVEGLRWIEKRKPDVVFLDIDMPKITGIEIAKKIKGTFNPAIVFTTAFEQFAYDVIQTEPVDYLVKPFGLEEIVQVLNRFKKRESKQDEILQTEVFFKPPKKQGKFKFKTLQGFLFVNCDDIAVIRASGNNCYLHLNDGCVELVSMKMSHIPSLINYSNFFKINRFTYINTKYIRKVDSKKKICVLYYNKQIHEEKLSDNSADFFQDVQFVSIS